LPLAQIPRRFYRNKFTIVHDIIIPLQESSSHFELKPLHDS
jgi:hypothetical protein